MKQDISYFIYGEIYTVFKFNFSPGNMFFACLLGILNNKSIYYALSDFKATDGIILSLPYGSIFSVLCSIEPVQTRTVYL